MMKSIKSKAFVLALGLFAFSGAFAQDTSKAPKPDTTTLPKTDTTTVPKHDTTSMVQFNRANNFGKVFVDNSLAIINDNKLTAKKETFNDVQIG